MSIKLNIYAVISDTVLTNSEQCVPGAPQRNTHDACSHPRQLAISLQRVLLLFV